MREEGKYLYLSQSEHEAISTNFLIMFIESQSNKISNGTLDSDVKCGSQAKMIEDLIWCFFGKDRKGTGIPTPSSMLSVSQLVDFIKEDVLTVISQYRSDLLSRDWKGDWSISLDIKDKEDDFTS